MRIILSFWSWFLLWFLWRSTSTKHTRIWILWISISTYRYHWRYIWIVLNLSRTSLTVGVWKIVAWCSWLVLTIIIIWILIVLILIINWLRIFKLISRTCPFSLLLLLFPWFRLFGFLQIIWACLINGGKTIFLIHVISANSIIVSTSKSLLHETLRMHFLLHSVWDCIVQKVGLAIWISWHY